MDALTERAERLGDDLAVEHVAARRERDLGEVAQQRLAVARVPIPLAAVDQRDAPKTLSFGLVGPAAALRKRAAGLRELRGQGRRDRERHGSRAYPPRAG